MYRRLLAFFALLIGAIACQFVETPEPASDRLTISITADPVYEDGIGPETKAVIHGTKMYWTPGDTLGVFPGRGSQVYFIVDAEGEAVSAPFDGGDWEFKANAVYRSYYPLIGEFYLSPDRIPVQFYKEKDGEVKLQTQVGNDSSIHTSEYLYMYTDPQEVINGNISFAYHHLWTVLKPIVTLPAGHYTKLTFSLDDPLFVVKGYFNLTSDTPAIIGTEYANEVSMNLDVTFDASTELTAYYATAPLDMQGKTLTITITAESGREYTYTYNPSKAYKAGTTYKLTSSESFANNVIYYTSTDGNIVTLYSTDGFGANIIDNTYENGQGIITFDGDVTKIGDRAFVSCKTLKSITIPDSVNEIGQSAFNNCDFTTITIPNSVESIGKLSFGNCSKLTEIILGGSVTSIEERAFTGCTKLTSIILPESLEIIGENAFANCIGLASIDIPDSVESIGSWAFYYCSKLTSINIPASVKEIGQAILNGTNVSSITVSEDNLVYDSRNNSNAIIESSTNSLISGCINTIIPESVTSIGYGAFSGFDIVSINLPDSIVYIDDYAFDNCSKLSSIVIPDSVVRIGQGVFRNCNKLDEIILGNSLTEIGNSAFSGLKITSLLFNCPLEKLGDYSFSACSMLATVVLPDSIKSIGQGAFSNCSGLSSITILAKTPPTQGAWMFSNTNDCPIYVPSESVEAYKTAGYYWSSYSDRIQAIPE